MMTMTIAEEIANQRHAQQYNNNHSCSNNKNRDNGILPVRKSKRLESMTCQPKIKTSRLRRLHQLFWLHNDDSDDEGCKNGDNADDNNHHNDDSTPTSKYNTPNDKPILDNNNYNPINKKGGYMCPPAEQQLKFSPRLSLQKIHANPNIYTIDNFLTESELQYFQQKINIANEHKMFKNSFVDGYNEDGVSKKRKKRKKKPMDDDDVHNNYSHQHQKEEKHDDSYDYSDMNTGSSSNEIHQTTNTCATTTSTNDTEKGSDQIHGDVILDPKRQRTSKFIYFSKQSDSTISSIEQRACELLSIPNDNIEPLQLVKYEIGQYFDLHHDLGVLYDDGSVELPQRNNLLLCPPRRVVTILVYLNDVKECNGGCTRFPLLKTQQYANHDEKVESSKECLDIYPKRGMAVMWCNITKDGLPDTRVVHSGQALVSASNGEKEGEGVSMPSSTSASSNTTKSVSVEKQTPILKYAINIWACEY